MCGISAGAISPLISEAVEQKNLTQEHPGPDSQGFWSSGYEEKDAVLAHLS